MVRLDGGIGRRGGLKIRFPRGSGGSTPPLGTIFRVPLFRGAFFAVLLNCGYKKTLQKEGFEKVVP